MRLHPLGALVLCAPLACVLACVRGGSWSTRPPEVTLEAVAPLPTAAVTADRRVTGLLDAALSDIEHGKTARASRAVLSIVCNQPVVTANELSACPPPATSEAASAWVLAGDLASQGSLELADGAPAPDHVARPSWDEARPDQLPLAAMAYERALRVAPSRMQRATVLYKLGWSRYRLERFDAAIGTFLETLAEVRATGRQRVDEVDLRDESLEYAAISIAETDWDGDGQDDPLRNFSRPEVKARLAAETSDMGDLYARVVSVLVDQSECTDATAALAAMSLRYPRHPKLTDLAQTIAKTCP